ncbi:hypothetical protein [Rhodoferax fermentans]|uniref:DUF4148 domain-containing protein n=1 Tax=Rhodoferax fermentans TaxID=28066 RepID=A0A1T1AWJ2_RHOFE|nr:hypothetical protein [Rhodoferax fermentans]MBK1684803.1 hypothetical protein [Rhodoferax fermentans]OOV08494.1 hypothetical protein RF819_18925 [Rhodoferax fermentans]
MTRRLRLATCVLTGAAGLLASPVAVLAQSASTGSGVPLVIQQRGQQQEQLIQGQAATQLSRRQANAVVQAPQPAVAPVVSPVSSPKPVTQADVLLAKEARIRRLNAAKVEPAAQP